jgi:hypothetical protein
MSQKLDPAFVREISRYLVSRATAKRSKRKQYLTLDPCSRGHIAYRSTKTGNCEACAEEDAGKRKEALLRNDLARRVSDAVMVDDRHEWFIYLVASDVFPGIFKIGTTKEPGERLKALQTGNPFLLYFHRIYRGGGHMLESSLHRQFEGGRVRGEWFALDAEALAQIEKQLQFF